MGEGRKFPGTQVRCQKENSFATREGTLKVFEALVNNHLVHVLARVAGEEADFGELAPEGNVFTTKNLAALAAGHPRKGQGQVTHPHAAQASVEKVDNQADGDATSAGQGTGKQPDRFQAEPYDPVFEAFTHCAGV